MLPVPDDTLLQQQTTNNDAVIDRLDSIIDTLTTIGDAVIDRLDLMADDIAALTARLDEMNVTGRLDAIRSIVARPTKDRYRPRRPNEG